jgi:hypothetical protein
MSQCTAPATIAGHSVPGWWDGLLSLVEELPNDLIGRNHARNVLTVVQAWLIQEGLEDSAAECRRICDGLLPNASRPALSPQAAVQQIDKLTDTAEDLDTLWSLGQGTWLKERFTAAQRKAAKDN